MCTPPEEDAPCAALAGLEQTMLIVTSYIYICKHNIGITSGFIILYLNPLLYLSIWVLLPFYTKAVLKVMNACVPLDGTLEALASVLLAKNVATQHVVTNPAHEHLVR